jgi:hypothetical protein
MLNKTMLPTSHFCVDIDDLGGNITSMQIVGNGLYFGGNFIKVNGKANASHIGRIRFKPSFFAGCGEYITVQNGGWHNPATWLNGEVPSASAKVTVRHNVLVTQAARCYSLVLAQGGLITLGNGIKLDVVSSY